jgi:hypothetical protein
MAVAFDAFSASTPSTGTQTCAHTPVGTPRAVLGFVVQSNAVDEISGVTYGGTAMTELSGSPNVLAGGEIGTVRGYFLGASVPTGAQNMVATASGTTGGKIAYCITLTGSGDCEVVDSDVTINSTSQADPTVTLSLGGRTCFAAIALWSGQDGVAGITPFTNWTARNETDSGSEVLGCYTYDVIGSTDVSAGWTQTAEDAVGIAVAVSEISVGGGSAIAAIVHHLKQQGIM